ncbi:MAG: NUDIX hydrolase [Opitutales bacterium]
MSSSPGQPPEPQRWQRLHSRPIAYTRIFSVDSVDFQHPAQPEPRDFIVISAPDWVNVIALTPERHLLLVRQFRFGINDFSLEIPGGVIDGGEDPVAAGVRELREETGGEGVRARLLGSVHPNPAMQNNRCHLVLVEEVRRTRPLDWDRDEEFAILSRPVDEVYALARNGGITHAMVLDALLLFFPHWEKIKEG